MTRIDRWCFSSPIILGFSSWNQSWYVAFAFAVCAWLLTKLSRRNRSLFGRRFWRLNFGRRTGPYQMASTVQRPIAVAVREALFTSSGGSVFSYLVSLCAMHWMRLLRLAHSIWDHSVVVLCFSGLCLRTPGRREPGFRGGPCPGLVGSLLAFSNPGS